MSLFPRSFHQDIYHPFGGREQSSPFASFFTDFDRAIGRAMQQHIRDVEARVPKFNPSFDIQETEDAYHLKGDLPGVEQKDLNIQFLNENTISISGRTEHTREEGTHPGASETKGAIENAEATPNESSADTSSDSSYHKPTVEDDATESATTASEAGVATPTSTTPTEGVVTKTNPSGQVSQQKTEQPARRYWVQERSVGTFERQFPFPKRIDQEGVKASLKNGVLSVLVPKAKAPVPRRIEIQ